MSSGQPTTSELQRPGEGKAGRVADAAAANWADRFLPIWALPYARLARFDRPIGAWLLLFPCWWGQALAERASGAGRPDLWLALLFFVGAFVMRGAGCTYNDVVDRDFDARVARTASRPIPSGQVSVTQALAFAIALSLIGFAVLVQLNIFTIGLGIASLALVAAYPFAKRFTFWPQLVLGLTFKWGALVGFAAVAGRLQWPAVLLYAGSVLWTIGYDTVYAHQDKADDAAVGLKSTALLFGSRTTAAVGGLYFGAVVLWAASFAAIGTGLAAYAGLALTAVLLATQIAKLDIDDGARCLAVFQSNTRVGWVLVLGIVADMMLAGA